MPFTVKDLIGDRPPPVTAEPGESVEVVFERMRQHDYTQLPVVDADRRPVGMVTSNSILRALTHLGTPLKALQVRDAMDERHPRKYQTEDDNDLFDLLDRLHDTAAVLVVDAEGRLTGIVNSYDTTEFLQRKAEDMMLVEDIEIALKEMIRGAHTSVSGETDDASLQTLIASIAGSRQEKRKSAVKLLQKYLAEAGASGVKFDNTLFDRVFDEVYAAPPSWSLDKLSFNDFIQLLLHEGKWSFFHEAFGLERDAIRRLLEGVRDTRNALAHFRGTISSSERDRLRFCVDWIARAAQQALAPRHTEPPMLEPKVLPRVEGAELVPELEEVQQGGGRYAPLAAYLRSQPKNEERIELSFVELEDIIRGQLPATARQHRSWWANDAHSHVQSRLWLDVGWRVATVNIGEEQVTFARARDRERLYIDFYSELQNTLREKADFSLRNASPAGQSWVWIAGVPENGPHVAYLSFSFALRNRFRVELYIDSGDATYNKQVFDALHEQRGAIEADFGTTLQWERLDDRRASRVAAYHPGAITDDPATLQKLRGWALETMLRFQQVIEPRMRDVVQRCAA